MKKIVVVSLICLFASFGYSQDSTQMDISQIPNEVGVLYEKAFIDIGTVTRGVDVMILEIKDLIAEKTKKYIRVDYSIGSYGSTMRHYNIAINKLEAESLITAMDKIVSVVNNEKKFVYTELEFKTYEGLVVGAYYKEDENKWNFYIKKDRSVYRSTYPLKQDKFVNLLILLRDAYKKL